MIARFPNFNGGLLIPVAGRDSTLGMNIWDGDRLFPAVVAGGAGQVVPSALVLTGVGQSASSGSAVSVTPGALALSGQDVQGSAAAHAVAVPGDVRIVGNTALAIAMDDAAIQVPRRDPGALVVGR